MSKFIMLVGTPLDGKSTYAENCKKNNPEIKIYSTDGVKKEYEEENSSKGTKVGFYNSINSSLKNGFDVMLDANNISKANRGTVFKKIDTDCEINIVKISTPLEIKYSRLRKRRAEKYPVLIADQKLFYLDKGLEQPEASEDERITLIKEFDSTNNTEKVVFSKVDSAFESDNSQVVIQTNQTELKDIDFDVYAISTSEGGTKERPERIFTSFEDIGFFLGISKKGMSRFITHLQKAINNQNIAYGYMWKIIKKPDEICSYIEEENSKENQNESTEQALVTSSKVEEVYKKLDIKPKLKGNALMKADKAMLEKQTIILKMELSDCDLKSNDMLHIVEFNEIKNPEEFVYALKVLRKYRRDVKNELEFIEFLIKKVPEQYKCKTLENIKF